MSKKRISREGLKGFRKEREVKGYLRFYEFHP